jgi:hypothetical protein
MFDGIIVGNISPGSGTVPTLQQVTDAGNETTDSISCNSVTVNTVSIFDAATAGIMRVNADDYKMQVTEGAAGFYFDFSAASETFIQIKNNSGAVLTDKSIRILNATVANDVGNLRQCTIPHGFGAVPNFVGVTPVNDQAGNFLGAFSGVVGAAGGYTLVADDTNIIINIFANSPNDTDNMTFNFIAYFIPL